MRTLLAALLSSALAVPILAVACAPTVRQFPGQGGGGSGGAGSTSTSSGMGGTGGHTPVADCQPAGTIVDVFTAAQVAGKYFGEGDLLAIPDEQNGSVHVIAADSNAGRVLIQSIKGGGSGGLVNSAEYSNVDWPYLRISQAWMENNILTMVGAANNFPVMITYKTFGDQGVDPMSVSATTLPVPATCTMNGYLRDVAFSGGKNGDIRYAVTCGTGTNSYEIYVMSSMGAEVLVYSTSNPDDLMSTAREYLYVNGTDLLLNSDGPGQVGYMYSSAGAFNGPFPIALGTTLTAIIATLPSGGPTGAWILAAQLEPDPVAQTFKNLEIWSGNVPYDQYNTLVNVPPPGLVKIAEYPTINDVIPPLVPVFTSNAIFAAGPTFDQKKAGFWWFKRDGTPLILGQVAYTQDNPAFEVSTAAAAPIQFGSITTWAERDGANPPNVKVRAQRFTCTYM